MKRFMLFGMWQYYPRGGMKDFIDSFDTEEEAIAEIKNHSCDKYHICDIEENRIVYTKYSDDE